MAIRLHCSSYPLVGMRTASHRSRRHFFAPVLLFAFLSFGAIPTGHGRSVGVKIHQDVARQRAETTVRPKTTTHRPYSDRWRYGDSHDQLTGASRRQQELLSSRQMQLDEELGTHRYLEVTMQPVHRAFFTQRLEVSDSYHDVLRIFYGDYLTNDVIDDMLTSYDPGKLHNTDVSRPRIGGLSDRMAFGISHPTLEGRRLIMLRNQLIMLRDERREKCDLCSAVGALLRPTDPLSIRNVTLTHQHRTTAVKRGKGKRRGRHKMRNRNRRKGKRKHNKKKSRKRKKPKRKKKKKKNNWKRKGAKRKKPKGKSTRAGRKRKRALRRAYAHTREMTIRTQCGPPVARLVRIGDESRSPNKEYFPRCTIVHQCSRQSGCCQHTYECAPKTTQNITRYFFVMEYQGDWVLPVRKMVEPFTLVNHTECMCKPVKQLPQCLRCSFPFDVRRINKTECTCDCYDNDQTCEQIKNGRKPLTESALRCIKSKDCHAPQCNFGVFGEQGVKTGYCPRPRRAGPHSGSERDYRNFRRDRSAVRSTLRPPRPSPSPLHQRH